MPSSSATRSAVTLCKVWPGTVRTAAAIRPACCASRCGSSGNNVPCGRCRRCGSETRQVGMRREAHPSSFRDRVEARPDPPDHLAELFDRIPVLCLGLGAVAEEQFGASTRIRTITMPTQTLAMVLLECSMLMQRSARTPLFNSALVPAPPSLCAITGHSSTSPLRRVPDFDDRLDAAERRGEAALVVMRPHAPDPGRPRTWRHRDRPTSRHLDAGIHMAVEHQARAAADAAQDAHRLPAGDAGIERMRHIHHRHIEADIGHPLGQMIGDLLFLERGTRDAQQRLLDLENARGIDVLLHGGQSGSLGSLLNAFAAGASRRYGWSISHPARCDGTRLLGQHCRLRGQAVIDIVALIDRLLGAVGADRRKAV